MQNEPDLPLCLDAREGILTRLSQKLYLVFGPVSGIESNPDAAYIAIH